MSEDNALLREYCRQDSSAAFAELVKRHLPTVYAGALRRVRGNQPLAEDVTQQVFVALARSASALETHPALGGWLHTTTRNIAAQAVRSEVRRTKREKESFEMLLANHSQVPSDQLSIQPMIDEALDALNDSDRTAVILRFFQGKTLAEIGTALQVTDNAARMRIDRALERMGRYLNQRGITSTAAALGAALTTQAAIRVPSALEARTIAAVLAAKTGGVTCGALFAIMATTKYLITAAAILGVGGVALFLAAQNTALREELAIAHLELKKAGSARSVTSKLERVTSPATPISAESIARAEPQIVTEDGVQERYRNAQKLARDGKQAEALTEFLWCYDEGMVRVGSFRAVRSSFLVGEIGALAKSYPPAAEALRVRRDQAERGMIAGSRQASREYAALNHALGENAKNLALFDRLTPDDPQHRELGSRVYNELANAGRYKDAASVMN